MNTIVPRFVKLSMTPNHKINNKWVTDYYPAYTYNLYVEIKDKNGKISEEPTFDFVTCVPVNVYRHHQINEQGIPDGLDVFFTEDDRIAHVAYWENGRIKQSSNLLDLIRNDQYIDMLIRE